MTAIIALKDHHKVYMGGDSCLTLGWNMITQNSNKILVLPNCLIGFAGAKSVQNLMEERVYIFDGDWGTMHLNRIWGALVECTAIGTESEILMTNGVDIVWCGNLGSWRIVEGEFETIGS